MKQLIINLFSIIVSNLALLNLSACMKGESAIGDDPVDEMSEITGYPVVATGQHRFIPHPPWGGNETMFRVNFADGRIKGYPTGTMPGLSEGKLYYVLYVGGNPDYGVNDFADNGDGTITDKATGLIWMQSDSKYPMNLEEALGWVENAEFAGYTDWRLPDAIRIDNYVRLVR